MLKKLSAYLCICALLLTGCGKNSTPTKKEQGKEKATASQTIKHKEVDYSVFDTEYTSPTIEDLYTGYVEYTPDKDLLEDPNYTIPPASKKQPIKGIENENKRLAMEFNRILGNIDTQSTVRIHTRYFYAGEKDEAKQFINLRHTLEVIMDQHRMGIWYNEEIPKDEGSSGLICKVFMENGNMKDEGEGCKNFRKDYTKTFTALAEPLDYFTLYDNAKLSTNYDNELNFSIISYANLKKSAALFYDENDMPRIYEEAFLYKGKQIEAIHEFEYNKIGKIDPIFDEEETKAVSKPSSHSTKKASGEPTYQYSIQRLMDLEEELCAKTNMRMDHATYFRQEGDTITKGKGKETVLVKMGTDEISIPIKATTTYANSDVLQKESLVLQVHKGEQLIYGVNPGCIYYCMEHTPTKFTLYFHPDDDNNIKEEKKGTHTVLTYTIAEYGTIVVEVDENNHLVKLIQKDIPGEVTGANPLVESRITYSNFEYNLPDDEL